MAAGHLFEPGTEYGPCLEPCQHLDCASTRSMAESPCDICSDPIGYERSFYNTAPDGTRAFSKMEHATCAHKRIDETTAR